MSTDRIDRAAVPMAGATGVPSLARLFVEHAAVVFRVMRRSGLSEQDSEDLCQEVFLVVQRRIDDFESRSTPRTWILGIARRVLSDHRRRAVNRYEEPRSDPVHDRRRRAVPREAAPRGCLPEVPVGGEQDRALEGKRNVARLDRALSALDGPSREAFVLYEIEGLTIAQIAEITRAANSTVFSRIKAARARVRDSVRAQHGEYPGGNDGI